MIRAEGSHSHWEAKYMTRMQEWSNPGPINEHGALIVSDSAHEKVTAEGRLKPWPGQSIVSFVPEQSENFSRTMTLTTALKEGFAERGIGHHFGWLPPESWHFTLVDGGNGQDVSYQDEITSSAARSFSRLRELGLQAPRFTLSGPFISGATTILKLAKPVDEQSWKTIQQMIGVIREDIHTTVGPEAAQRIATRLPDDWVGHMAVGYFTQESMSAKDYTRAEELLHSHRSSRDPLVVTLDRFELREFSDMGNWGDGPLTEPLILSH